MSDVQLQPRARGWRRYLRLVWLAIVAVVAVAVLVDRWGEVAPVLADLRILPLVLAVAAGIAAVGLSSGIWSAVITGLGAPLPASAVTTVFFLTQLGKYLPGAVWPLLAQMELARDYHVTPRVSAAALALFTWVHLVTGVFVALLLLPLGGALPPWAALLAVPCAVVLLPAPLSRLLDWGLRLVRRAPLPQHPSPTTMVRASVWAAVMWLLFGVHLAALALATGEPIGLLYAVGVFGAGWVVGFVVLVAPAGVGAREAALTAVLVPHIGTGAALAVVLVSRLALVVADVAWAGVGLFARTTRRSVS